MDDIARYNQARWNELVAANILYSRPWLDLDVAEARRRIDPMGLLTEVAAQDVLCLASGGGQQSAAFALLGAHVTVFDFSEAQLQRDRQAAAHYQTPVKLIQGDMRDLSPFGSASFDVVWQAYSINFVPSPLPVFQEVARVLRVGGFYRLMCQNPFVAGLNEADWNGRGYPITRPYLDGAELQFKDPDWVIEYNNGAQRRVAGPKEFRHTLSLTINGLVKHGFVIRGLWEETTEEPDPPPGSWEHFKLIAPPWLTIWTTYQPNVQINEP